MWVCPYNKSCNFALNLSCKHFCLLLVIGISQNDRNWNVIMELSRTKMSIPIIAMSLGNSYYTNPDVLLKMAFWIKQQEKVSLTGKAGVNKLVRSNLPKINLSHPCGHRSILWHFQGKWLELIYLNFVANRFSSNTWMSHAMPFTMYR